MSKEEMVILREVVREVLEKADELARKSRSHQKLNEVEYGQFLQILSTISMFQSYLSPYGLEDFGLDFDPDEKFRETA